MVNNLQKEVLSIEIAWRIDALLVGFNRERKLTQAVAPSIIKT
jgi:hypothetical protein